MMGAGVYAETVLVPEGGRLAAGAREVEVASILPRA